MSNSLTARDKWSTEAMHNIISPQRASYADVVIAGIKGQPSKEVTPCATSLLKKMLGIIDTDNDGCKVDSPLSLVPTDEAVATVEASMPSAACADAITAQMKIPECSDGTSKESEIKESIRMIDADDDSNSNCHLSPAERTLAAHDEATSPPTADSCVISASEDEGDPGSTGSSFKDSLMLSSDDTLGIVECAVHEKLASLTREGQSDHFVNVNFTANSPCLVAHDEATSPPTANSCVISASEDEGDSGAIESSFKDSLMLSSEDTLGIVECAVHNKLEALTREDQSDHIGNVNFTAKREGNLLDVPEEDKVRDVTSGSLSEGRFDEGGGLQDSSVSIAPGNNLHVNQTSLLISSAGIKLFRE